jgi:thiamine transporter ThiT
MTIIGLILVLIITVLFITHPLQVFVGMVLAFVFFFGIACLFDKDKK